MSQRAKQPIAHALGKHVRRSLGRDWDAAYAFMAPTLILMGGLIAYPFLRGVWISFTDTRGAEIGSFVGLANYADLWSDRFFRQAVAVTVRFTFWATVSKLVMGLLAALLLHGLRGRASLLSGLMLLPWVMPEVVVAIAWKGLLDPLHGGVSYLLLHLGLLRTPYPFLGDIRTALPSVILVNVWQGLPFVVINALAGLKHIDQDLYEAAAMDGAGRWRRFLHVTLPGLRYVLLVVTLLSVVWTFNDFRLIFLLTGGGPMNATKVYSVLAYQYGVAGLRFGAGTAVAMSVAPAFVLTILVLSRYMMGEYHAGAEAPRGIGPGKLRTLSRVLRYLLRRPVALFWLANDGLENALERATRPRARRRASDSVTAVAPPKVSGRRQPELAPTMALLLLLAFVLLPFCWLCTTAFKTELQITRFESVLWPRPWSLDQFRMLLGPRRSFLVWLRNTLILSCGTSAICTLSASLGAYALTRLRWRGAQFLAGLILVFYLMPAALMVIPIYQLLIKLGLINSLFSLAVCYPTFSLPFATWLMMGYYGSIPEELEAAALVDGCDRFQTFSMVVWPLIKPALVAVSLFSAIQAWGEFLFAYTFIASESKMTVPVGLAQMIFSDVQPWGELAAASLLVAVPVLAVVALGQRYMVAGLTAGALKG